MIILAYQGTQDFYSLQQNLVGYSYEVPWPTFLCACSLLCLPAQALGKAYKMHVQWQSGSRKIFGSSEMECAETLMLLTGAGGAGDKVCAVLVPITDQGLPAKSAF